MSEFRTWLTMQLLRAAWVVLPRSHPGWHGLFDAACAIRDEKRQRRHMELVREMAKLTNHGEGAYSAKQHWRARGYSPEEDNAWGPEGEME